MTLHPTLRHFHAGVLVVTTITGLAIAVCVAGSSTAAPSGATRTAGKSFTVRQAVAPAPSMPVLVTIRASHHRGFDRVVSDFRGTLPGRRTVRYVTRLIADPSGRTVPIAGRAILEVTLAHAVAHNSAGATTAPARLAVALPNAMSVVRSGDFEGIVSYGIGLAQRTRFHVFALTRPSRVVIDIATPFRTVLRRVYLFNQRKDL